MLNFVSCKYNKENSRIYKGTLLKYDRFFKNDTTIQGKEYKKGEEHPLFLIDGDRIWFNIISAKTYDKTQPIINMVLKSKTFEIETNVNKENVEIGRYILFSGELYIVKNVIVIDSKNADDVWLLKNVLQKKTKLIIEQTQK